VKPLLVEAQRGGIRRWRRRGGRPLAWAPARHAGGHRAQLLERLTGRLGDVVAPLDRRVLGHGDRRPQARLGVGPAAEPAQRLGARDVRVGDRDERVAERRGERDRLVERRQRLFVAALARAREAEPLMQVKQLAAAADVVRAQRRDRLAERLLRGGVVALAHRPLAALCVQLGEQLRRRAELHEGLAREPLQALGAQEVARAHELVGVAQVGLEAVVHRRHATGGDDPGTGAAQGQSIACCPWTPSGWHAARAPRSASSRRRPPHGARGARRRCSWRA
jgi:hypothetical protein